MVSEVGGEQYALHRARLAKSRADQAELETDRLKGVLIPAHEVEAAWGALVSVCRQRLRAIGAKVAPRLKVLKNDAEYKEAIDTEVDLALDELATAEIVFDPPPVSGAAPAAEEPAPDDGEVRAAPEEDGEPVG